MEQKKVFVKRKENWKRKICRHVICRVSIVYFVCAIIGLLIPAYFIYGRPSTCDCECTSFEFRIDCLPNIPRSQQTKEVCVSKMRCCWQPINDSLIPQCFHRHPTDTEYYVVSSSNDSFTAARLEKSVSSSSELTLNMRIERIREHHLRVHIFGEEEQKHSIFSINKTEDVQNEMYEVQSPKKKERLYVIVRRKNRKKLFDTSFGPLIYRRDYIEFSTYLPSYNLYGLGQARKRKYGQDFIQREQWTLYSRFTTNGNQSRHFPGVHPFYLCVEGNGDAHGVLIETSRPMEVTVTAGPLLTIRIVGGTLDIHFFLGPSPSNVIRQMQAYVGNPSLPPYWALGHHVCNSITLSDAESRIEKLRKSGVSQESDCGVSQLYQQSSFKDDLELSKFIKTLSRNSQKFLVINTPQLPVISEYSKMYLRNPLTNLPCKGELFGDNNLTYIDFFSEESLKYIEEMYVTFQANFSADGALLDYNTPVNTEEKTTNCGEDQFEFLPGGTSLSAGTVCWNCSHGNTPHYMLHNLYGHKHMESVWDATNQNDGRRFFILSLSTFLGSGKYGGSWGGPNNASWDDLRQAVADMLEYNAIGIPMSGAPYCGYYGDYNQDLCSRWLQVASLSPLTIGYRGLGENAVSLTDNGLVSSVGRMAVRLKYSLLPYLYTLFYKAYLYGDTVVRPVFFEFPKDEITYHLDSQYMWGSSLLISPVLTPKTQRINVYFPKGCWYDYHVGTRHHVKVGRHVTLPAIESHINLHIRGGHIIPGRKAALTVAESLRNNFTLTIAIDCAQNVDECVGKEVRAKGEFYIDDGMSQNNSYLLVNVTVQNRTLTTTSSWYRDGVVVSNETELKDVSYTLEVIRVFGVIQNPSKIEVNLKEIEKDSSEYDEQYYSLSVKRQNLSLLSTNTIRWEYDFCKQRQQPLYL